MTFSSRSGEILQKRLLNFDVHSSNKCHFRVGCHVARGILDAILGTDSVRVMADSLGYVKFYGMQLYHISLIATVISIDLSVRVCV